MDRKNIFPIVLIGLAAWYFMRQARRVDIGNPYVSFLKLEGLSGVRINLRIPIINTSDFTSTVQGFLGQLMYGDNSLGVIRLVQPIQIPRFQVSEPEFTVLVSLTSVAFELRPLLEKLFTGDNTTPAPNQNAAPPIRWSDFKVKGVLKVDNIDIDINQNIFG